MGRQAREEYLAKLRDPRWQRKRLEILERDGWQCGFCMARDKTLHVHHRVYRRGADPWDYEEQLLVTLCEECHEFETDHQREADEKLMTALRANTNALNVDLLYVARLIDENPEEAIGMLAHLLHVDPLKRSKDGE